MKKIALLTIGLWFTFSSSVLAQKQTMYDYEYMDNIIEQGRLMCLEEEERNKLTPDELQAMDKKIQSKMSERFGDIIDNGTQSELMTFRTHIVISSLTCQRILREGFTH